MEIAIPVLALSGLYFINNQRKNTSTNSEAFTANGDRKNLPNTDIPNRNYPTEYPIISTDADQTSKLSTVNRFDGGVYTDKYFNPNTNISNLAIPPMRDQSIDPQSVNNIAQFQSLTGQKVDSNYFQHNNMVPFFGGHLRTRHVDANTNESVLDNYNGSGSQIIKKTEQSPLFKPDENVQWAYGAPNNSEFFQSRVNVGTKMNNVKPFEEQKVGPGLGLGYTNAGQGGFNSGVAMREQWIDRGVDELRVANKPKASGLILLGHEGPANSFIKQMAQQGIQEKNRPDTSFEFGQDRYFTTTGIEKKQPLIPVPIEKFQSRPETTTNYVGGAGVKESTTYVAGEYMPSHNNEYGPVPLSIANRQGKGFANENDYSIKSNVAYPNSRSANSQNNGYFGSVGGNIMEAVAPLLDILRPSKKENTIGTLRPYQNPKTAVQNGYLYNPNDAPAVTIKDTTLYSLNHLNINGNQRGGGYEVAEHQPIHNARDETTDIYYCGNASAGDRTRGNRSQVAERNQRNNEKKLAVGYTTKGNMALFNGNINAKTNPTKDNILKNNRAMASAAPSYTYQSVGVENYGKVQGNAGLYQSQQLDRNDGSILSQLKGNPFALNINGKLLQT